MLFSYLNSLWLFEIGIVFWLWTIACLLCLGLAILNRYSIVCSQANMLLVGIMLQFRKTTYHIYSSISRIFLYQNIAQKVRCDLYRNIWSTLNAIQNFFEMFSCYCFLCYRLFIQSLYLSPIRMIHITLHHLSPSWDVPEVNWDYFRTVTAGMTSMFFNFL